MRTHVFAGAVARRGLRVLILTLLLTAVGCCENDFALSECWAEISHDPCFVPSTQRLCLEITVSFIAEGSDCTSCSSCPGSEYRTVTVGAGDLDKGLCIGECNQVCGQECAR